MKEPVHDAEIVDAEYCEKLAASFCVDDVTVISGVSSRKLPNSTAMSLRPVALLALLERLKISHDDLLFTLNFVAVRGPRPTNEELHFHTGHILGYVTCGQGFVTHAKAGEVEEIARLGVGDAFVLPANVRHTFFTENGGSLDYVVLEFGAHADGQRHHY